MNRVVRHAAAVSGFVLLMASVARQWFAVPVGAFLAADTGEQQLVVAQPWATAVYKVAAVAMVVVLAILWWIGRHTSRATVVFVSAWFVALLFYPYGVIVGDPTVSGEAAWMESGHRNIIWSGGDINNSMEFRIAGAYDKLLLTDDAAEVSTTPTGDWQLSELSLARFPDLVARLGYSDNFFEFMRLGWILALMGSSLILIWLWAADGDFNMALAVTSLKTLAGLFLLGTLLAWGRSFVASGYLAAAAEHTARGHYDDALVKLHWAAAVLPVLREDTFFVRQVGLLEAGRGRNTPHARLYRANVQSRNGWYQPANLTYQALIEEMPATSSVRREACRGLLRSAINSLNAGHNEAAAQKLEVVLAAEPCNLKANYALQLAQLRCNRGQRVASLVDRMDAIYEYVQYANKESVQFAARLNLVAAEYRRGDLAAAMNARRK